MRSWQTAAAVGVIFAPLSILLVAGVTGGVAGLSRSRVGLVVVVGSIVVAGIAAGRISARQRSREKSSLAPAVIGGFLIGGLSLAVMGIVVLVATVIYFENSHFTW
jgi:hypothetical protein